ncbi:hypothetical protein B0H14DRAFT_2611502 [Mycena olivaceomarginata]|nr:hypothetical protein B0H14DRAFT_2611502 [Mycena olivaceomarginata]
MANGETGGCVPLLGASCIMLLRDGGRSHCLCLLWCGSTVNAKAAPGILCKRASQYRAAVSGLWAWRCYIRLETPPPSPPSYIRLPEGTPTSSQSRPLSLSVVTPTRRQRSGSTRNPRNVPKKRVQIRIDSLTLQDGPDWDMAAPELVTGSEPTWNSQGGTNDATLNDLNGNNMKDGESDDCGYSEYCEAIQEEGGAFYQIGAELFVVNGWDPRTRTSKPAWYHLQRSTIGERLVTVCRCPLARPDEPCIHERFLAEYGKELFPVDEFTYSDDKAVLFSRQEVEEGLYINHFSTPSPNSRSLNGRVIVEYTGDDTGTGRWLCSKDSGTSTCAHISKCRDMLQKLVLVDPTAKDNNGIGDGCSIDYSVPQGRREARETGSVSYLPIAPPLWAALVSDPVFYQRSPALENVPDNLRLKATSSCCCSEPRHLFNSARTITSQKCTVYGLFRSWETTIEVQGCPDCSHRLVGPDCRELGIFNYNNRKLFAHDLLDEYTSAYTSSETPFSAWVSVVARRYELHCSDRPFATAQMFRAVWFAYANLLYLEGDMICPRCGPSPKNTIWDGVTLAFNRKHLLPTLEPPTVSQSSSLGRTPTKYVPNQQLLPERKLRGLGEDEDDDGDDEEEEDGRPANAQRGVRAERAEARARAEMLERLDSIPIAVQALKRIDTALGQFFEAKFGEGTVIRGDPAPEVYRRLFIQAGSLVSAVGTISAEESVLQMVTAPAMDALEAFVLNPPKSTPLLLWKSLQSMSFYAMKKR